MFLLFLVHDKGIDLYLFHGHNACIGKLRKYPFFLDSAILHQYAVPSTSVVVLVVGSGIGGSMRYAFADN